MIDIQSLNLLMTSISNLSSTVFWVRSADFKKQIYVSPSFETIYGKECNLLYENPQAWTDPIDPEHRYQVLERLTQRRINQMNHLNDNEPVCYSLILPSNERHFIKNQAFTVCDDKKSIVAYAGMSENISEALYEHLLINKKNLNTADNNRKAIDNVIQMLTRDIAQDRDYKKRSVAYNNSNDNNLLDKLSVREKDCLQYLIQGMTAKETAKQLNLSPRTVETYIDSIKLKFGCRNKMEIMGIIVQMSSCNLF